jgi:hypothetical protein
MLKPQSTHRAIEFHDAELAAVARDGASVVLLFSAVYVHESTGVPGVDRGVGWYQPATLTIAHGEIVSDAHAPATVADGWIRLVETLHQNHLPILDGTLEGSIELSLLLSTAETLLVRGAGITIELSGQASPIEQFCP